jgi:formamidopyrimidine-DNA glycosylase
MLELIQKMPELPEVETIRSIMEQYVPGHTIESIHLRRPKMLRGQKQRFFREGLKQREIAGADRRGKFLLIRLDRGSLLVHLGMTGQVFYVSQGQPRPSDLPQLPDKHTHLTLKLNEGATLYFRDVRMFGRFALLDDDEEKTLFAKLGPEPLGPSFTAKLLFDSLQKRSASIKAVLLNQTVVAGLGNIYADEALFRAGILPQTSAGKISWEQTKILHRSIRRVLKEAVYRGGTSISDYLDPRHRKGTFQLVLGVYGREGKPCLNCGTPIKKDTVAQRGTHWCPHCQR